jgi:hypothetical protein
MAWSQVATTHVGELPAGVPAASAPPKVLRREDEARQLRARLLRMIERNELVRKAAAESPNAH